MDIELNPTFSSGVMRFLVKVLQIDNGIMVNTKTIDITVFIMVKPIENDKHLNFELLADQEMQIFEFHEMSLSHGIPRAGGS